MANCSHVQHHRVCCAVQLGHARTITADHARPAAGVAPSTCPSTSRRKPRTANRAAPPVPGNLPLESAGHLPSSTEFRLRAKALGSQMETQQQPERKDSLDRKPAVKVTSPEGEAWGDDPAAAAAAQAAALENPNMKGKEKQTRVP
ncbi:hypothetical protein TRAPUB_3109 [Trametes pubescens]|uniref:Uncharacterized protein n=1 Tax=Trametes pubescens TaxID=154538 RepID=A0A1M2VEH2_TRAPU|nr:hypothetical protein TRAPUB_3109 [Trametes pubescens]